MIFSEILNTYFGWCPRFTPTPVRSTMNPLTSLSTIGKATLITLLTAWGLYNLTNYEGIPNFLNLLKNGFSIPQFWVLFLQNIFGVISGAIIIVLLVDYIISGKIHFRHRVELSGLLLTQAAVWFLAPFYEVTMYLSGGGIGQVETRIPLELFTFILEAVLLGYLAYRILSNKAVLTKNSFLLLSLVFLGWFIMTINPLGRFPWNQDLLGWATIGLLELVYGVASIFCFRNYLRLRRSSGYDLDLPPYIRAMLFVYGFVSSGLFGFAVTWDTGNLFMLLSWDLLLYFVFFVGVIVSAFFPFRFRVGENILGSQELGP